uniref:Uncharacterized protein n=1 Tax=Caenorhabditis japonica TaxID=281687 RepID=A0A8R1HH52_CAEJA
MMHTSSSMFLLAFALLGAALARPQFGGPGGPPPGMSVSISQVVESQQNLPIFQPVPPPIAAVLPRETLAQLEAIHADPSLSEMEKHQQIDQIMVNLPDEVHDRIPPPPGFAQLPADVQASLKALHRDKTIDFQQRQNGIRQILDGLAPEHKRLLPPPPPGFPQRQ